MSFRVPHLVGNTRLRDHGLFPTILRSELNTKLIAQGLTNTNERLRFIDRLWPVPVPLETIMQMTWRVREWRMEAGTFLYTGSKSPTSTPGATWAMTATWEEFSLKAKRVKIPPNPGDPLRDVTDEQDLLGPYTDTTTTPEWKTLRHAGVRGFTDPNEIVVDVVDSDTGPETGPFVTPKGAFEFIFFGDYTIYDPDTELFYPKLGLDALFINHTDFGMLGTSGPQAEFHTLSTAPIAPPLSAPAYGTASDVPQGTLTIINPTIGEADIVIPLGMFGQAGGSAPPAWFPGGSGSVAVTLTPIAWWPYKTSLGDPVYDTSTGAQVADPFA